MRSHPFPYLHIKVGKIALGDADIVPIDPVGGCEAHAGNAGIAVFDGSASPYAVRPALGSYGLFTNNGLGRLFPPRTLESMPVERGRGGPSRGNRLRPPSSAAPIQVSGRLALPPGSLQTEPSLSRGI